MVIVLTGLPAIRRLVCRTSGDDTPVCFASWYVDRLDGLAGHQEAGLPYIGRRYADGRRQSGFRWSASDNIQPSCRGHASGHVDPHVVGNDAAIAGIDASLRVVGTVGR